MKRNRLVAVVRKHDGSSAIVAVSTRQEKEQQFIERANERFYGAYCGGMGTMEFTTWQALERTEPHILPNWNQKQKGSAA